MSKHKIIWKKIILMICKEYSLQLKQQQTKIKGKLLMLPANSWNKAIDNDNDLCWKDKKHLSAATCNKYSP